MVKRILATQGPSWVYFKVNLYQVCHFWTTIRTKMAPRTGKRFQDRGRDTPTKGLLWDGRCKASWKREFKLPWREAGPPYHHGKEVDLDQWVVNKELSLSCAGGRGGVANLQKPLSLWTSNSPKNSLSGPPNLRKTIYLSSQNSLFKEVTLCSRTGGWQTSRLLRRGCPIQPCRSTPPSKADTRLPGKGDSNSMARGRSTKIIQERFICSRMGGGQISSPPRRGCRRGS